MLNFISQIFHPEAWLSSLGPLAIIAVVAIVFAESGLFFGFFLPGDSLLFTAGLLSSPAVGLISFPLLALCSFIAAVLGDNVGYWFGHKVGPKIFSRDDSLLFKKKHLDEAHKFYEKHGTKTVVLARFVPFVRTFAPIVAGATQMHYSTFMRFNILGGLLWAVGITSLGYFLGNIPVVEEHYEAVILLVVVASLGPVVIHFIQSHLESKKLPKS